MATNQVIKWLAGAIINNEFNENIMVSWKAFKRYLKYVQVGAVGGEDRKPFELKEQCHEDFAVLGQFCAKIIAFRL